jgi:hypothetical protein
MSDDSDIFDGGTEVSRHERGATFGLSPLTYGQLAHCALRVAQYAVEPAVIRKLRDRGGCELVLYGREILFTVRVEAASNRIGLFFLPLDSALSGPGCELFRGFDQFEDWHKMTDAMIRREGEAASAEMLGVEPSRQHSDGA